MIRNYLHIFTNLPGILARINSELEGKASKASVTGVRPGWKPTAFSFSRQMKEDHRGRDRWLSVIRRWLG